MIPRSAFARAPLILFSEWSHWEYVRNHHDGVKCGRDGAVLSMNDVKNGGWLCCFSENGRDGLRGGKGKGENRLRSEPRAVQHYCWGSASRSTGSVVTNPKVRFSRMHESGLSQTIINIK